MTPIKQIASLVLVCLIWGTTWQAIKISLQGIPPFTGAAFRFALAAIVLYLYTRLRRFPMKINQRELWFLLVTSVLVYFIDYGLIYWGELHLSAGVTAIFFATYPLFTAIFSNFVFKSERFRLIKYLGLAIGFAGITIVFFDQLKITAFNTKIILASVAIIISAAAAAMGTVIIKKYLSHMNPVTLSVYQMAPGSLFLISFGFITEDVSQIQLSFNVCLAVFYLAVIGSAITFVVYYRLLSQMSAVSLSTIIYVTPIVALIADYFMFKNVPPLRTLAGAGLIFFGIWITQMHRKKHEKHHIAKNPT